MRRSARPRSVRPAIPFLVAAIAVALLLTTTASSRPDSGPRERVNLKSTTDHPHRSAGLTYRGRYHGSAGRQSDPPPLRRLAIELPKGAVIDTSAPARCRASDERIMLEGESACPASARVGSGAATLKTTGGGTSTYPTVIYNARNQILELVKSGDRVIGVVHTYVHGTTLAGPIPTCITGGHPPKGCPFDQLTLLANHLHIRALSAGRGRDRRHYGTTPPVCPPSGVWRTRVELRYADGAVDTVKPTIPCNR